MIYACIFPVEALLFFVVMRKSGGQRTRPTGQIRKEKAPTAFRDRRRDFSSASSDNIPH